MNTQTSLLLRIADSRHPSPSGSLSSKTDHNSAHRMVMPGLIGGYAHQGFSSLSSLNIKLCTERCTSRCIKQQAAAARFSTMQSTPLERGREKNVNPLRESPSIVVQKMLPLIINGSAATTGHGGLRCEHLNLIIF